MLGADVGTVALAPVLSFDLSWLSPLLIFFGVIVLPVAQETRAPAASGACHRPGAHHPRAAAGSSLATTPITQAAGREGDLRLALRRPACSTCWSARAVHDPVRSRASRSCCWSATLAVAVDDLAAGGARPRARRQPRQRPPRHARPRCSSPAEAGAWPLGNFLFKVDRLRRLRDSRCCTTVDGWIAGLDLDPARQVRATSTSPSTSRSRCSSSSSPSKIAPLVEHLLPSSAACR